MDAPLVELLIRAAVAVVATGATVALGWSWRHARAYPASSLIAYLATVVGLNAAWRWYILWVGLQSDSDGGWATQVEPYIRSMGNALLILLYVGLILIAFFHARRLRQ